MDLLFKRYADPFSLMDGYIQTSRFCEFIRAFSEQKIEDDRWEYFLHKVWDKSYSDFCETLQVSQDLQTMSDSMIETTVKQSMNILRNFNPEQEEGETVSYTHLLSAPAILKGMTCPCVTRWKFII